MAQSVAHVKIAKSKTIAKVDMNFKEYLPFKWMNPSATPTLYFLNENEDEIIDTVVKRLNRDEFSKILKEVVEVRNMD